MTGTSPRPDCTCHGEPMYWIKDPRYKADGFWRCAVHQRTKMRRLYASLDEFAYNRRLLQLRRTKALARRRKREAARG